jgi:photosystem II stability/assembly factor-like uncharacterized protein
MNPIVARPDHWRSAVFARSIRFVASSFVIALVSLASPASVLASTGSPATPPGFRAQSISFISPNVGWMLGAAPCGDATCATVVHTTDGGSTWSKVGTVGAPITLERESGVTEVRFADNLHGWAFEPGMWSTSDGGVTWARETPPGDGRLVMGLAADSQVVYAVVTTCRLSRECDAPATLWQTTPGAGSWTQVAVTLPVFEAFNTVTLSLHGTVAYLAVPAALFAGPSVDPDVLDVTLDGQTWTSRPDPCDPSNGETLTSLVALTDTKVALLCQGNIGFGKAFKQVFRSNDNAQTTQDAGILSEWGITSQLTGRPNGTIVLSSYSIGSWIYLNTGGQTWSTSVDFGDGGQGWNDVTFTTASVGFVVHGPAACCGDHGPGELWTTQDGGVTWGPTSS